MAVVSDINKALNPQWRHSNRVYAILEYNYIVFPITLALVFYSYREFVNAIGYWVKVSDDGWNSSAIKHLVLFGAILLLQMPPFGNTLGLCLPIRPNKYANRPKIRRLGTLHVCLVTKGTNVQTVLNSTRCWDVLTQRSHPSVRFHVVLDSADNEHFRRELPSYITIDEVPGTFSAKRAKFKARALEFFRQKYKFSKEDWILHLDEESEIDERVMRTSLDFIEKGTADYGMGTIYYTSTGHWDKAFTSAAEVMRVTEDYGRFQLPVRLFRRPFLGWVHGSWILINGAVENKVTWDTENVCEDYWFAYHAAAQGFKFDWLHAIVREQPPCTFTDLWKQRRRWYTGIGSFDRFLVRAALLAGALGGIGSLIFPFIGVFGQRIAVPAWYREFMIFNDAAGIHAIVSACLLQDFSVIGLPWTSMLYHVITTLLLWPVVHIVHIMALFSTMMSPAKGFAVINKT
ncbi:hypothetical protein AtubIFM61612_007697 [Aspergillus tubingensis]|uniref:Glycosyltransferase 2-like domain-containing protein n=1 Tax=Aspergillus niger TaxID=5061 RepID=A0A100INS9_ASPNG|nr:hypothetical protein AKAW_03962 [Aspergillus niger]GLB17808.1 hypothetical protein AtubIFM61612_007697 [Aspergillus tubingensis]